MSGSAGRCTDTIQVGGDARIRELRRSRVVIDEIDPPRRRVPDFPSGGQRAEIPFVDLKISRHAGIVPRGHTRLRVQKVYLSLLRRSLLVAVWQRHGFVQLRPTHVVSAHNAAASRLRPLLRRRRRRSAGRRRRRVS